MQADNSIIVQLVSFFRLFAPEASVPLSDWLLLGKKVRCVFKLTCVLFSVMPCQKAGQQSLKHQTSNISCHPQTTTCDLLKANDTRGSLHCVVRKMWCFFDQIMTKCAPSSSSNSWHHARSQHNTDQCQKQNVTIIEGWKMKLFGDGGRKSEPSSSERTASF